MTDESKASVLSVAQFREQLETPIKSWKLDCNPHNLADDSAYQQGWDDGETACAEALEKVLQGYAEARQAQEIPADGEDDEQPQRTLDIIARMLGWMNTPPRRTFEQEIRAMKARVEARQASAWQPIESAPKGITLLIALSSGKVIRAVYYEAGTLDMDDEDAGGIDEEGKNAEGGWFEDSESHDPAYFQLATWNVGEPVGWMPLPLAPPVLEDDAHER